MYNAINLEDINPHGELLKRALLNFQRLQEERYRFPVLKEAVPQAPGDSIGRTILALTLLSRAIGKKPEYLQEMIIGLHEMLNKKGYISVIPGHEEDIWCEMEIAGHNALLRGLCEYYTLTNDASVLEVIKKVIDNLIIPSGDYINEYPSIDPGTIMDGEQVSLVSITVGKWRLSTDIGCVFLALDGITHAYQLFSSEELRNTIIKYIKRFSELDLVNINAQTHSTLSAVRGIIRFYETEKCSKGEYLELARKVYEIYKKNAWTDNYANYNWFERPEWTEPCAVIDSFTVAVWLWNHTGETQYLEDAHLILYNAFMAGQRPNGGFGCDICLGTGEQRNLKVRIYEAECCCTMRGGEGLSRAIQYSYFISNDEILIPFPNDNTAVLKFTDGNITISQSSKYPLDGGLKVNITDSTQNREIPIKVFVPFWIDSDSISLIVNGEKKDHEISNGFIVVQKVWKKGDIVIIDFNLSFRKEKAINMPDTYRYFHGPVLLGCENNQDIVDAKVSYLGKGKYISGDVYLIPANDMTSLSEDEAKRRNIQVLFK